MEKFKNYSRNQVELALLDCHETLRVGGYSTDHPYGKKLWAEIDALRERGAVLSRKAPRERRDPVWLTAHD